MITYNNRPVRILSRDSDPTCLVWCVYQDEPDTSLWVRASDLVEN